MPLSTDKQAAWMREYRAKQKVFRYNGKENAGSVIPKVRKWHNGKLYEIDESRLDADGNIMYEE